MNPQARDSEQMTFEEQFQSVPFSFSGRLMLYDLVSRRLLNIETEQGDSEVLLILGDTVYYRVNDELYRASLGKQSVDHATLLAKDPNVQRSHWAFMGSAAE